MELLIVLTALCLLAQLALCYGCDRQYRLRSRDDLGDTRGAPRQPSTTSAMTAGAYRLDDPPQGAVASPF